MHRKTPETQRGSKGGDRFPNRSGTERLFDRHRHFAWPRCDSMSILSSHIVIVTGKGGVGKSTVAAALAAREAKKGKKVLLVEFGEDSFLGGLLGIRNVSIQAQRVDRFGFDLAIWDTETCLREYVLHFVKIESLFKIFFENRVMRTFINVAPALKELALLGKLTSGERHVGPEFKYDLVVVDGYASGHMLALMRAPKGMADVIKAGPMGYHSEQIYKVLTDPKITSYVIVTLSDELPTTEALELHQTLKREFSVEAQIVMNRCLVPPVTLAEITELSISNQESGLQTFARFLKGVLERQDRNQQRLKQVASETGVIPLIVDAKPGPDLVEKMEAVLPL